METVFRSDLLEGKSAVVTGGGSGINLAIAERFAKAGAKVGLIGRTPEKLEAAAQGIRKLGAEAATFPADVRDAKAMESAMADFGKRFGGIDVLVCGAAGNFPAPAMAMSSNGFKSVMDIDLLGTFHACRFAFEHLKKPGASVINISAGQAEHATALQAHVCAAKAGVDMLTRTLAIEWGAAGVRLNSIAPGPIDDTEGMRRLAPTEEARKAVTQLVPLGRFGTKEEIAELALFLASPAAAFCTGGIFYCDGGMALAGYGTRMLQALGG